MGSIFEKLSELNQCHSVCVGFLSIPSITGFTIKDYFIVAKPCKKIRQIGFYYPPKRKDVVIYSLNDEEILEFKLLSTRYTLVIRCDEGRVYELPGQSLKTLMHVQAQEIHA